MNKRVVLHISDLHFGTRFAKEKWSEIGAMCTSLAPQLVIITGDVVDSPRRDTLRQAAAALKQLQQELRTHNHGREVPFIYVPGNHDARYFGLIPLSWTYLLSLPLLLGLTLAARGLAPTWGPGAYCLTLLAALPLAVQWTLFTSRLHDIFRGILVDDPVSFPHLRIGVIPLDSSIAHTCGAHGKVITDMVTPLARAIDAAANEGFFWIAAVHHHPLPIPLDDFAERSMILKNAGTVLLQLINQHVPLVLHGHKHNAHFSRLLLGSQQDEREICVLAAGTATRAERRDSRYSFNVIEIDGDDRAEAIVFEALGKAAFKEVRRHPVSSSDFFAKRQLRAAWQRHRVRAGKLLVHVSIDECGDAIWAEQLIGLATAIALETCSFDFPLATATGYAVGVRPLGGAGRISINARRGDSRCITTSMHFVPLLAAEEEKIDCGVEYLVKNFCALDSVQHDAMYRKDHDRLPRAERICLPMPSQIALEQCVVHLQFPPGYTMPLSFHIERAMAGTGVFHAVPGVSQTRIDSASTLLVTIPSPTPGALYRINWQVPERRVEPDALSQRCEHALMAMHDGQRAQVGAQLRATLGDIAGLASKQFIRNLLLDENFELTAEISVYVYDTASNAVRRIFNTQNDTVRGMCFSYGNGLVGLALKAERILFTDKLARSRYDTIAYARAGNDELHDILAEDGSALAVPLYCVEDLTKVDYVEIRAARRPYGVMKIGFPGLANTAFDNANSFAQADFDVVVSSLFMRFLRQTILAEKLDE